MLYRIQTPELPPFEMEYYGALTEVAQSPRIYPPHVHDTLELYILVEGDVSFMVEDRLYRMESGDILVTKPNELHHCILNSRSPHRHFCFNFRANSDFLCADLLAHAYGKDNLISPTAEEKKKILTLCEDLLSADESGRSALVCYSYAVRLIASVTESLRPTAETRVPKDELPPVLRSLLNDLNEGFATCDGFEALCEKYFISQSTLNRLFRKHLQTTPRHYLEGKRLAYSRVLLCEGKRVTEVVEEAGFGDCSHYIRIFHARFGMTPLQYQRSHAEPLAMRRTTKTR